MICPVCHHTNIKEGSEECPKCNTPLTGDNLVLALQKSNRDQRNQKIAMTFALVFVAILSAAYLFMITTDDGLSSAGEGEIFVPGASLRNLGYTLDEKTNHIEELQTQIENMQATISSMEEEEETPEVEEEQSSTVTEEEAPQASIEQPKPVNTSSGGTHVVSEGETLWSIAQSRLGDGFKSQDLASLNNLNDPDLIVVGETLRLQ